MSSKKCFLAAVCCGIRLGLTPELHSALALRAAELSGVLRGRRELCDTKQAPAPASSKLTTFDLLSNAATYERIVQLLDFRPNFGYRDYEESFKAALRVLCDEDPLFPGRFLRFVTASPSPSDRITVRFEMRETIPRIADREVQTKDTLSPLPTAHTCTSTLDLPLRQRPHRRGEAASCGRLRRTRGLPHRVIPSRMAIACMNCRHTKMLIETCKA